MNRALMFMEVSDLSKDWCNGWIGQFVLARVSGQLHLRWPHSLQRLRSVGIRMRRDPDAAEVGSWGGDRFEPAERKELVGLRDFREALDPSESPDPLGSDLDPLTGWEGVAGVELEAEGEEDVSFSKKDKSSLVLRCGFGGMEEMDEKGEGGRK